MLINQKEHFGRFFLMNCLAQPVQRDNLAACLMSGTFTTIYKSLMFNRTWKLYHPLNMTLVQELLNHFNKCFNMLFLSNEVTMGKARGYF